MPLDGARYISAPAVPASAPAMAMESTMVRFSLMPAYRAALRLKPHARSSYPKVVLFSSRYMIIARIIAISMPALTLDTSTYRPVML